MTPTFTVLMGVLGRPTLKASLDSIARQDRVPGDQVLVGIDTYEQGERPDVEALVRSYGEGFEVCSFDAGFHCWGTAQINLALAMIPITGSHIFTIGDDDVFVDNAYATLRPVCAVDPLRPVLYRFMSPWREVLWDRKRMERSKISGCCIAAPRAFVGPHPTVNAQGQPYPEHDFDWMQAILKASGRDPLWLDEILVIARPEARGADVTHRPLMRCWACPWACFGEDTSLTDTYCPRCHVVLDVRKQERLSCPV
jgi:hypothetical protein